MLPLTHRTHSIGRRRTATMRRADALLAISTVAIAALVVRDASARRNEVPAAVMRFDYALPESGDPHDRKTVQIARIRDGQVTFEQPMPAETVEQSATADGPLSTGAWIFTPKIANRTGRPLKVRFYYDYRAIGKAGWSGKQDVTIAPHQLGGFRWQPHRVLKGAAPDGCDILRGPELEFDGTRPLSKATATAGR